MSGSLNPERARDLLEAQLDELGALRNAHARDPRFKQWRQATLTVIQRIWPGDAARAERFRRVPFSPPSTKMNAKATRSFFEKGCAEAVKLIRSMFPELRGGVNRPPGMNPSDAPAPGEVEDDFPVVDLPARGAPPAAHDDDETDAPAAHHDQAEPRRPNPPGVRARHDDPPSPTGKVSMRSSSQPSAPLRPLREMLGFPSHSFDDDAEAPATSDPEEVIAFDDDLDPAATHGAWPVDEVDESEPEPGENDHGWEAPQEFQLPGRAHRAYDDDDDAAPIIETEPEGFPAAEPVAQEPVPEPAEEPAADPDTGDAMEEFLRTSPVLKASARPVRRREAGAAPMSSAAAASLVALASEVAQLGVPEGQRAGMRATLIELARRVDDRTLDWDALRESFQAVLDFPPLARRVIPLLIPYLDVAA
jgi:hypothetical protein